MTLLKQIHLSIVVSFDIILDKLLGVLWHLFLFLVVAFIIHELIVWKT